MARSGQNARGSKGQRRWIRPVVDGVMTMLFLLQMVPGKMGNQLHEAMSVGFVLLFGLHHMLNRGWLKRLGRRRDLCGRLTLASDVMLTICVVGMAVTGMLMSRSLVPMLAVPSVVHLVRPLHGALAYAGLMTCAFHVGLHMRVVRGYAGLRGVGKRLMDTGLLLPAVLCALGMWAFNRLGVATKLTLQPSFPDGMTPLIVQLGLHVALCAPFALAGSLAAHFNGKKQ